ncbi:hypothetical protein BD414DRAFT_483226 [Trametes punicea]|nr:hypothetical protein BD414DRAFT_483226 [Trametes punicea]
MSQSSTYSVQTFVNDMAPVNDEGQVVCHHRLPAKRMTSRTPTNPNRDFYTCPKDKDDPGNCKFFMWADDPKLCSALQSKRDKLDVAPATPQRPSQAGRALFSRSPAVAAATLQKRQRTPSPTSDRGSPTASAGSFKHRRVDSTEHNGGWHGPTPNTAHSRRTEPVTDVEGEKQDSPKAARLKSIQDALRSVLDTPRDSSPASSTPSGFLPREDVTGPSRSASYQRRSDVPNNVAPPSLSQNIPNPHNLPRHTQDAQSDAGTSIDTEIELAEMEDMESKAVQTSPIHDDSSMLEEDFWSTPPPHSAVGSLAGTSLSRTGQHQYPQVTHASGAERAAWSPTPPQTPGRGVPSRVFTAGENEDDHDPSMLPTPPRSSQLEHGSGARAGPLTTLRGRTLLQEMLASPTASKGNRPDSSASNTGSQDWQTLQDDPENPFQAQTVAHRAGSRAPTTISMADGVGASASAGALSVDSIASHIAALQAVPEYIAKLERREKAARKSAEIKGRKIAELEEEVQRLRKEKRALEETVAALQMRR